jgi:hypothetical protein
MVHSNYYKTSDVKTGTPVKSIFNPHANGCVALDMTDDAAYVATLSAPHNEDPQVLQLLELELPSYDCTLSVSFEQY